jgi:serine/threonine protein kinase
LGISFDFDRPSTPCLVYPYYRNGNITNYININPAVDKIALVSHMMQSIEEHFLILTQIAQAASALSYLHSMSIIHGNLKGVSSSADLFILVSYRLQSNILINDDGVAVITDIGFSHVLQTSRCSAMASGISLVRQRKELNPVTTEEWRWRAPELMTACANEEEIPAPHMTEATDVYAFACVIYEVCVNLNLALHSLVR